jgi:hypothetical protein
MHHMLRCGGVPLPHHIWFGVRTPRANDINTSLRSFMRHKCRHSRHPLNPFHPLTADLFDHRKLTQLLSIFGLNVIEIYSGHNSLLIYTQHVPILGSGAVFVLDGFDQIAS